MGHKVHPYIFRLGTNRNWKSRRFGSKRYQEFLKQDVKLRDFITKKLAKTGLNEIIIERSANAIDIKIQAARPGLIIGRGGSGIEDLKAEVKKILVRDDPNMAKIGVKLEVEEVRQAESFATIMGSNMAEQIEKRMPFRRVMKMTLDKIMQNRDVQGAKVLVKGRLNGADIARTEWQKKGKIPLNTLRSDIDYTQTTAFTTYGTVGIKIWIYKGEKF